MAFQLATSQWPAAVLTEYEVGTNGVEFAGYHYPTYPIQVMDQNFKNDGWFTTDMWYELMTGTGGDPGGGGGDGSPESWS